MTEFGPEFESFLRCWDNLPRTAHAFLPQRRDINPTTFGELLQHTGLAKWLGPQNMEILFYGSGIERASGFKITGMNYYDLLPQEFIKPLSQFHQAVLGVPCGAHIADVITTESGNSYLYQSLQYPVTDKDGNVVYLLVYGLGRKPYGDESERKLETHIAANIKELEFIDLGGGAPKSRIENFVYHR